LYVKVEASAQEDVVDSNVKAFNTRTLRTLPLLALLQSARTM